MIKLFLWFAVSSFWTHQEGHSSLDIGSVFEDTPRHILKILMNVTMNSAFQNVVPKMLR